MTKVIKMYSDEQNPYHKKLRQKQWNVEQLRYLVNKLNLPNKREIINKIKSEQ